MTEEEYKKKLEHFETRVKRLQMYNEMLTLENQELREELKSFKEPQNEEHIKMLLENQNTFTSYRDFEEELFKHLTSRGSTDVLKKMAKNTDLSKEARARSAYLYTFLTNKPLKLSFTLKQRVGLYHGETRDTGNGLARMYGLLSGVDMQRFNQYKMTGSN